MIQFFLFCGHHEQVARVAALRGGGPRFAGLFRERLDGGFRFRARVRRQNPVGQKARRTHEFLIQPPDGHMPWRSRVLAFLQHREFFLPVVKRDRLRIFLLEFRELLCAVRAARHLFEVWRNVRPDFQPHVVEAVRRKLRAEGCSELGNLADAVIFAERHELCVGHGGAKNFRAGPGKLAILYADRSAVFLQGLRKLRVLRSQASCK